MPRKKRNPPTKADLKYEGWRIYSNSGVIYRRWMFLEAHAETATPKGATLEDCGPGGPCSRFRIRGPEPEWPVLQNFATQQEVEAALGLPLAPWQRPPREIEINQLSSLRKISGQMDALSDAKGRLDLIRKLLDQKQTPPTTTSPPPPTPAQQNEHLRLVSEDTYRGGEAFRDWELLHDAPEITGLKGDVLREEDDHDVTPFRLKRAGRQIGSPEWWQVRHLFSGLAAWHTEAESSTDTSDPPMRPVGLLADPDDYAYLATADIPGTRIRKGDVLNTSERLTLSIPARVIPLVVEEYEVLRTLHDNGADLTQLFPLIGKEPEWHKGRWRANGIARVVRDRRKWGLRKKVWTPRLFASRRIAPSTPKPVDALSDEGAIFELLSGAGCRMPKSKG